MSIHTRDIDMIVDEGRTHFAIGDEYAGSVNTYNNIITKFFAWIAGKATTVTVNGQQIYANTNSLQKFMHKNVEGFTSFYLSELKFRDLTSFHFKVLPHFESKDRFMVAHISKYMRELLSKDLFKAIATGNQSMALQKIRLGAELNTHAWLNEDSGEFFFKRHFAPSLPTHTLSPQRFTEATPLLLALRLNQVAVAALLYDHGADPSKVGQTTRFARDLIDTKTDLKIVPTIRSTVVEKKVVASNGFVKKETSVERRFGLDAQSNETLYFIDKYEDRYLMTINPHSKKLEYTQKPSHYTEWNTHSTILQLPIL